MIKNVIIGLLIVTVANLKLNAANQSIYDVENELLLDDGTKIVRV